MKSKNRFIKLLSILIMIVILSGCETSQEQLNENIMLNMQNGKTNSVIREIYSKDILDVETITFAKEIYIEYYDYDLNSDGIIDKIVIVRSPLHSGSHGDTLDFLIGNKDGTYNRISGLIVLLYAQNGGCQNASIHILDNKTNGFKDILVNQNGSFDSQDAILLKYDNGQYIPSK